MMNKYSKLMFVLCTLSITPLHCAVSAERTGFSKIWDGTKEVASGAWSTVSSPFRSGKDKKAAKKDKKINKKESCVTCGDKCSSCESRREKRKNKKRKN